MEVVFGLLLVLLRVSQGVDTRCDGREDGAQCYGALGGIAVLRVMGDIPEKRQYYKFKKKIDDDNTNKYNFTLGFAGFTINSLSRDDDAQYELRVYHSNGTRFGTWIFNLTIQAPVSSVGLHFECPSQAGMAVSCSSGGGDGPQYRWTLDGRPLTEAELLRGRYDSGNITLRRDVTGNLLCSVRNHISNGTISTCDSNHINCTTSNGGDSLVKNTLCSPSTTAPPSIADITEGKKTVKPSDNITSSRQTPSSGGEPWFIMMVGVLSVMIILLVVVGAALVCAQKKKKKNASKEGADEGEPTYMDVRIVQRQPMQRRVEVEVEVEVGVEYGQVKFSKQPRRPARPTEDDCVYAKPCDSPVTCPGRPPLSSPFYSWGWLQPPRP